MTNLVSFPGLGLEFELNRVAVELFGRPIYWYGVIIASGMLLAVYLCGRWGKRFGITEDEIMDMMLFAVPAALIAVRIYYVLFNLEMYRNADGSLNWGAILRYSDGGLAIYGAIISSAIVLLIFCRVRKISFLAYADLGVHGLFIGQLIGRWGNFMNVEAFGGVTDVPWRMCGDSITAYLINHGYATDALLPGLLDGSLGVHPTFFYESAWNLVGLLVVYYIGRHRKFDGQCFLFYFFWYGLGRTWIEGLRTDSLYFFGLQIMGYPIRVSQMIAAVTCIVAGIAMVWMMRKAHDPADMYVNRLAAPKAAQEDSKEKEEE